MRRYKYEISKNLDLELPNYLEARLESYGNSRREVVDNVCVYLLDAEGGEVKCLKLSELSDLVLSKCVIVISKEVINAVE